jgi:hypothetical protein
LLCPLLAAPKDLPGVPIEQRKQALAEVLPREGDAIIFNVHYDCDGATVFKHACALGCEGIRTGIASLLYASRLAQPNDREWRCPISAGQHNVVPLGTAR